MPNESRNELGKQRAMSEWMAIAQWHERQRMARPDIVFEIQNAEGPSLFTPCTPTIRAIRLEIAAGSVPRGAAVAASPPRPMPEPKRYR